MNPVEWLGLGEWDAKWFTLINHDGANAFLDWILPWSREKFTWVPLYILLAYYWIKTYRWKGLLLLGFLGLSVAISDQLSAHLIKFYFHRPRPCHNPLLNQLMLRIQCGAGYSFVSSHASNHFTIAAFTAIWFRKIYPRWEPVLYFWAGLIGYAQIYVGVHYPLDVLGGALLGVTLGWTLGYWAMRWVNPFDPKRPAGRAAEGYLGA